MNTTPASPAPKAPLLENRRINVFWADPARQTDGPNNFSIPTYGRHYVETDTIAMSPGHPEAWVGSDWMEQGERGDYVIAEVQTPVPLAPDTGIAAAIQKLNEVVVKSGIEKTPQTPWNGHRHTQPPAGEMYLTIWDGYDDRTDAGTRKYYSFPEYYDHPIASRIAAAARTVHNLGNTGWTDRGEQARPPKRRG